LTEAQLESVRAGLRRLLSDDADSVLIYTARDARWLSRETLGRERSEIGNLL
jgi:CRISPR-associated protein Cas2